MKSSLLVKFETTSERVKGLSFHPKRPWILASLHDGSIQLWDYRMEVMIDRFDEHIGPVRGVCFHPTQPLFVSGGDDYKVKVWNYQSRKCLFSLTGHVDYIRTVEFHQELPWILSASDDQTVRIWNWQSRTCLAIISGHNHYVMCARFAHPTSMLVSASLDTTVRIWNYSSLRTGGNEVTLQNIFEGHTRGVNWVDVDPQGKVVSGSDDRDVHMWDLTYARVGEVFSGHSANVSCVLLAGNEIISNSEDRTLRVWDKMRRRQPIVVKRDADRFWVLAKHPHQSLLAAGHDSGFLVFKLRRERAPIHVDYSSGQLFYVSQPPTATVCTLVRVRVPGLGPNITSSTPASTTANAGSSVQPDGVYTFFGYQPEGTRIKFLHSFSGAAGHSFLVIGQDNTYNVVTMPDLSRSINNANYHSGHAKSGAFVSSTRFVVLDKSKTILLKTLQNETKRKITIPGAQQVYPGGVGRVIVRCPDSLVLYDVNALKVVNELSVHHRHILKYAIWSPDSRQVALLCKSHIYVANSKLNLLTTISESARIKSAAWDPIGVLVYATSTHLKYLLPNGDKGIICTLGAPIYIAAVSNGQLSYVDRSHNYVRMNINTTEYLFKYALWKHKSKEVARLMGSRLLVGQAIVAYVQQKGYPEIAMHFVADLRIKFALALECGAVDVAFECASQINTPECWRKLGQEALRQGNTEVAEAAYLRVKDYQRLSFLYVVTGNRAKLQKLLTVATHLNDIQGRFNTALLLGDVRERVAVLRAAGHLKLAFVTATLHSLNEEAGQLAEELQGNLPPVTAVQALFEGELTPEQMPKSRLLIPRQPLSEPAGAWPLLQIKRGFDFTIDGRDEVSQEDLEEEEARRREMLKEEREDMSMELEKTGPTQAPEPAVEVKENAWGNDVEIELSDDEPESTPGVVTGGEGMRQGQGGFVMPELGKSLVSQWEQKMAHASDACAAGALDQAMHLLNQQIGAVNFTPLKKYMIALSQRAIIRLTLDPSLPSLPLPLTRPSNGPLIPYTIHNITALGRDARDAMTAGSFAQAQTLFTNLISTIPLILVDNKQSVPTVLEALSSTRDYLLALRLETARNATTDPLRKAELAVYATHCQLAPVHVMLTLWLACKIAFTVKAFRVVAGLCRRLLDLSSTTDTEAIKGKVDIDTARRMLKKCDADTSEQPALNYDPSTNFAICAGSLKPVSASRAAEGRDTFKCPYCSATYSKEFEGTVCEICHISKVGAPATGLRLFLEDR